MSGMDYGNFPFIIKRVEQHEGLGMVIVTAINFCGKGALAAHSGLQSNGGKGH